MQVPDEEFSKVILFQRWFLQRTFFQLFYLVLALKLKSVVVTYTIRLIWFVKSGLCPWYWSYTIISVPNLEIEWFMNIQDTWAAFGSQAVLNRNWNVVFGLYHGWAVIKATTVQWQKIEVDQLDKVNTLLLEVFPSSSQLLSDILWSEVSFLEKWKTKNEQKLSSEKGSTTSPM
jgi:hypothetical protein